MKIAARLFQGFLLAALAFSAGAAEPVPPTPPAPSPATLNPAKTGPKIKVAEPVFDFGKASVGEVVQHTFVFTNVGDQTLEIREVRPTCGCTASGEWSRRVEPGQTGTIPIQLNTAGFGGPIMKPVTITCNDPTQPAVVLQVKGTVWKPVEVSPQFAVLNVIAHSKTNAATVVRIVNNEEKPLTLAAPEVNHPSFAADVKEVRPGHEFELTIRNTSPLPPGNVQGALLLKTSSLQVPSITVNFLAMVNELIAVMPAQITIPAGPASNLRAFAVSIRNNSGEVMKLSEPSVNARGVDVQMHEIEPGRQFSLTVVVPSDFTIAPEDKVELTLKSSHPQFPVIKVPIRMQETPAAAVPPRFPAAPTRPAPPAPPAPTAVSQPVLVKPPSE